MSLHTRISFKGFKLEKNKNATTFRVLNITRVLFELIGTIS